LEPSLYVFLKLSTPLLGFLASEIVN